MENVTGQDVLNFVKDNGLWYIDLPQWKESKESLLMVSGADTFLEFVSDGNRRVSIQIKDSLEGVENPGDWLTLILDKEKKNTKTAVVINGKVEEYEMGGGDYTILGLNYKMWLCDVTKFVFNGVFPERLYFKNVTVYDEPTFKAFRETADGKPVSFLEWVKNLFTKKDSEVISSQEDRISELECSLEELTYRLDQAGIPEVESDSEVVEPIAPISDEAGFQSLADDLLSDTDIPEEFRTNTHFDADIPPDPNTDICDNCGEWVTFKVVKEDKFTYTECPNCGERVIQDLLFFPKETTTEEIVR